MLAQRWGGASDPSNASCGRHLAVLGHLGPSTGADPQVVLDARSLVRIDCVERERPEQLIQLGVGVAGIVHRRVTPTSTSEPRSFFSPDRMRDLTVPSGSPRISAASR